MHQYVIKYKMTGMFYIVTEPSFRLAIVLVNEIFEIKDLT